MHRLLEKKEKYVEESYEEVNQRYEGFADTFFEKLQSRFPDIFSKLKFYRPYGSKYINDVNAVYDKEIAFAIALDPYCEAIFMWDEKKSKFHFSECDKDPVEKCLMAIETYYLKLIKETT
ncbi:MAG: hypothetical protein NE327_15335 [Lentisphaeraceae bacterium]|nr:hypothetical protein [Lentisphaeraceae bacterium]